MQDSFKKYNINISDKEAALLEQYHQTLIKWQKAINLIGTTTIEEAVIRHFLDSAQLINHIEDKNIKLVDMGSGAGFPGLVLAMMGIKEVHLIESDVRKATFLRTVSRETNLNNVIVHNKRVENCEISNIDLITARALAPLDKLFSMAKAIKGESKDISYLFMKGEKLEQELEESAKKWSFEHKIFTSLSDSSGKIIKITNLEAKNS